MIDAKSFSLQFHENEYSEGAADNAKLHHAIRIVALLARRTDEDIGFVLSEISREHATGVGYPLLNKFYVESEAELPEGLTPWKPGESICLPANVYYMRHDRTDDAERPPRAWFSPVAA